MQDRRHRQQRRPIRLHWMLLPTSQINEPDVTPNLFSLTTPEPTIIPETPTIFKTPMDGTPAPQSAQLSSDHLPSERKTREDSPPHRRTQHTQSRLDDRTKITSKLTTFEESEDEDKGEEPTNIVCSLSQSSLKNSPCSKDRREARTSSEDPTRRHKKMTGSRGALSSDKSSSLAKDNADVIRLMYLETFYIQIDQFAYLRGTLVVGQYDCEVIHWRGRQHANADGLGCRPTQTVKLTTQSVADNQQVQQPARVCAMSKIPTAPYSRRNQSIHAVTLSVVGVGMRRSRGEVPLHPRYKLWSITTVMAVMGVAARTAL